MKEFKGKTALITGAANGFGLEFSRECARRGMKVLMVDIMPDALAAAQKTVCAESPDAQVTTLVADVSLYEEVQKMVKAAVEQYGSLDLLFNNAGVYYSGNVVDIPVREVQWMWDVNVMGVIYGMKEAIPVMKKQGTPCHIVNVASVAGLGTNRMSTAYHATKHACVAATESTYLDLQKDGADIGMTMFCPGYIQTQLHHSTDYRPARYKINDDPYYTSEGYRRGQASAERVITTGEPIDVVVPCVFGAIENNQFYAKTKATEEKLGNWVKKRHRHIEESTNLDVNDQF